MEDKIINLELTLKDVNSILTFLGEMKYNQVAGLIAKVQSQTVNQVNSSVPSAPKNV